MNYSLSRLPSMWPSPDGWNSVLRAMSGKLRLSTDHTVVCYLAQMVSSRRGIDYAQAYEIVEELLARSVFSLAVELGFQAEYAAAVARALADGLRTIQVTSSSHRPPWWPNRPQWLAIDRTAAGYLDMDPSTTISTNLARYVSGRLRMPVGAAKRLVHHRVAVAAERLAAAVGMGWFERSTVRRRLESWLNSFDD